MGTFLAKQNLSSRPSELAILPLSKPTYRPHPLNWGEPTFYWKNGKPSLLAPLWLYWFRLGCARYRSERREIRERGRVQTRALAREDDQSLAGVSLGAHPLRFGEPFGLLRGVDVMSVRPCDSGRDELVRLLHQSGSALLDRGQSLREEPATLEALRVCRPGEPSATVSRTLSAIGRRIGGAKRAARRVTISPTFAASPSFPASFESMCFAAAGRSLEGGRLHFAGSGVIMQA